MLDLEYKHIINVLSEANKKQGKLCKICMAAYHSK